MSKTSKVFLIPFIFIISIAISESIHYPMWMDEYVFYRLSGQLPEYSTTTDWFYEDRPEVMNWSVNWSEMGFDYDKALSQVYDTPIYPHTPLAPLLVSPAVKGLNWVADKEFLPHIEEQPGAYPLPPILDDMDKYRKTVGENVLKQRVEWITLILRLIPFTLLGISMWLIYKLLQKKVGVNAVLCLLPIVVNRISLSGIYLFYWDAFMMFFFVLTLYFMETKPNGKWQYLTACCMVNTKMFIPALFLLPLVIKGFTQSRKQGLFMMLTGLSILPFYFTTAIVTGDLFYPFNHYLPTTWIHNYMYTFLDPSAILNFSILSYLVMTAPILYYYKKHPTYATLWVVTIIYSWGTGLGVTHLSTLCYTGALCFSLVAGEWKLAERAYKLLKVPVKEGAV